MRTPAALRPSRPAAALTVTREQPCAPELYRRLYLGVGAAYHWVDRAAWTDAEIRAHVTLPGVEVWVGRVEGEVAGFFELRDWPDGSTEVAYFGLLPPFIGRGLGGACSPKRCAGLGRTRPGVVAHLVARPSRRARQLPGARAHGDAGRRTTTPAV